MIVNDIFCARMPPNAGPQKKKKKKNQPAKGTDRNFEIFHKFLTNLAIFFDLIYIC